MFQDHSSLHRVHVESREQRWAVNTLGSLCVCDGGSGARVGSRPAYCGHCASRDARTERKLCNNVARGAVTLDAKLSSMQRPRAAECSPHVDRPSLALYCPGGQASARAPRSWKGGVESRVVVGCERVKELKGAPVPTRQHVWRSALRGAFSIRAGGDRV